MSSIVEICNIGLQALGVARMAAYPDTTTTNGKEMTFAYEPTKLATLRRHRWNFAKKRVQLAADSAAPVFDYAVSYTLPADCLRILLPSDRANRFGRIGASIAGADWRLEGRKILTNWTAPLDLSYIYDVVDPNEMDSLFREVLGINLALKTCKKLTGSNQLKLELQGELKTVLSEAKATNAIENIADDISEDLWITVRA